MMIYVSMTTVATVRNGRLTMMKKLRVHQRDVRFRPSQVDGLHVLSCAEDCMTFLEALAEQRWDDHRYYHHNRINQSLHLFSALSFILAYALVFVQPAVAVMIGWLFAMPSRQLGHFFFEPRGYDEANGATHEFKEQVKVGYNLRRKVVLLAVWLVSPAILLIDPTVGPTLGGLLPEAADAWGVVNNISMVWLAVGAAAIVLRSAQLCVIRNVQTGLVWATKILTDPFHDVALYYRAPAYVLRGELFDPIVTDRAA
jgi:hypothetical protein